MTFQKKPIIHNGYEIEPGLTIERRIDRVFFTEVYELSDGTFMYLFLELKPNEELSGAKRYDIRRIKVGETEYLYLIQPEYSQQRVSMIVDDLNNVKGFDCIAGMNDLKNLLIADVINPLRNPEKFEKFNVSIPNGILLYGPPGCGKTFMVRKLAEELGYNFFDVKHSDLATPFIHGAVGNIGKVFEEAKNNAPAIVFFDEISGLVSNRQNMNESSSHKEEEVNEFLVQLNDAADNKILVVGATNYIERIDPAILRSGRMDKKIYVPPPDHEAREELFKLGLFSRPYSKDISFAELADATEGYSSADIIEGIIEGSSRIAANLEKEEIDQELLMQEVKKHAPVEEGEVKIGFGTV